MNNDNIYSIQCVPDHKSQIEMPRHIRISTVAALIMGLFALVLLYNCSRSIGHTSFAVNENTDQDQYSKSKSMTTHRIYIPSKLQLQFLAEYEAKIDGWFSQEILYVFWVISEYQYELLNVFGGIGEIGVHHGKLTCYLYLLRRYREQTLFAVDVFDNQALNKDGSGRGQKDLFLTNIRKYAQVYENGVAIYAGSSLDLNPIFSADSTSIAWWRDKVVANRGLQLVSVDGGHTALLTYSDLCLASNAMIDGGVVAVDDINHHGWLGVQDGTGRFLAETSTLMSDTELENELAKMPNRTNFELSKRIVAATTLKNLPNGQKSKCSRLVPFLQYFNKLFLTTPKYYPHYIQLIGSQSYFANDARKQGVLYLEYQALRLTIGSVPVWTDNHDLTDASKADIFKRLLKPVWLRNLEASDRRKVVSNVL